MVEGISGLGLILLERVGSCTTVLELGKHELVIAGEDGTGRISVVRSLGVSFAHLLKDVVDEDGGLREDGSGSLGGWQVADISETKDVRESLVLEGVDIDIKPVVIKGKFTGANELRSSLRRDDVQKIKLLLNCTILVRESGDTVVFVDLLELVHQVKVDVLAHALLEESITVLITGREDNWSVTVVVDLSVVSYVVLSESRLTEVHDLLGSTAALKRELRACEDSLAATESFSEDRCLVGTFKVVHGTNRSGNIIKSFLAAFDQVVTKLEAWVDDKIVICGLGTIAQSHLILAGVERCDSKLLPVDSGGLSDELVLGANNRAIFVMGFSPSSISKDTSSDHSVRSLVMMGLCGVKDSDVSSLDLACTGQLSDQGLTTATCADNSHFGVLS